jgi:hypothetical protein
MKNGLISGKATDAETNNTDDNVHIHRIALSLFIKSLYITGGIAGYEITFYFAFFMLVS